MNPERLTESERFWGHATAFGAMWDALEATVGTFLHALHLVWDGSVNPHDVWSETHHRRTPAPPAADGLS